MHIRQNFITTSSVLLLLTLSAHAAGPRPASAKFRHSVQITGITLPAGRYEFQVAPDSSSVTILRQYEEVSYPYPGQGYRWEPRTRQIATVFGEWVQLASRARKTQVMSRDGRIWQIVFRGQQKAIRFSSQPGRG